MFILVLIKFMLGLNINCQKTDCGKRLNVTKDRLLQKTKLKKLNKANLTQHKLSYLPTPLWLFSPSLTSHTGKNDSVFCQIRSNGPFGVLAVNILSIHAIFLYFILLSFNLFSFLSFTFRLIF